MKNVLLLMLLLGSASGVLLLISHLSKQANGKEPPWAKAFTIAFVLALVILVYVWDRSEGGSGFVSFREFTGRR